MVEEVVYMVVKEVVYVFVREVVYMVVKEVVSSLKHNSSRLTSRKVSGCWMTYSHQLSHRYFVTVTCFPDVDT